MATPTVAFSAVTAPGGTGTSITPTLSTHAVGDVLLIFVGNSGNVSWGTVAGWTLLNQSKVGTAANGVIGTWLWHKVVSGDSIPLSGPVFALGATVTRHATCRTLRGADLEGVFTLTEWDDRGFTSGTSNPARPPTVISNAPEKLFLHDYVSKSATNAPDPSGYTQDQEAIASGTLVINSSRKDVADQGTTLSNQDASPTSGVRWVAGILSVPSPDYVYYRSSSSATVASGTNITPALPTGATASDVNGRKYLIIATVEAAGNNIAIAPNTPADWTEITGFSNNTSGNGTTVRKYWCLFDGSMDRRFNRPTAGELSAYLNAYHNSHQTNPIGVVNNRQNASSTTSTWDALTRTSTRVLMNATCVADGTPTFTAPSGWTERMDGLGMTCAEQHLNATGSTASASFTLSTASPTLVGLLEIRSVSSVGTLVIQNSSHSHAAESPSLTQVHALALQSASHAQTAENVTLTVASGGVSAQYGGLHQGIFGRMFSGVN